MNQKQNSVTKINLIVTCLSLIISLLTVACGNQSQVNNNQPVDNNNPSNNTTQNLFSCQKNTEKKDQETWSVMYQKNPWLSLTKTNINSDNLEKSCNEIATTLDKLTKEGLFKLSYNVDSNNKNNYLLCGETKSNLNNCSLITTLKVTENIDKTFQEIAQPLFPKSQTFETNSGGTSVTYSTEETTNNINLTPHLTEENIEQK